MAGRVAEVLAVTALATAVTLVVAVTVLRAPSDRIFGLAIVGRHHDPFTAIAQFDGAPRPAMYWQPVTDTPGGFLARMVGGVAAYNVIVLLSFPLAAAAAFLLARHLSLSPGGATLAAMAYAFSPFHIAHAAYHPHIAQVQWIPLYLLALWRCLDRASIPAVALLIAATAAVALSNFYGGLIAAVITPAAIIAYWFTSRRSIRHAGRNLAYTLAALALAGALGVAYVFVSAPAIVADRAAFAFPAADLVRYSATGLSFLTPPVANPFFGAAARAMWVAAGVRDGLLEQQVFLGWTLIALAVGGTAAWLMRRPETLHVPAMIGVAAIALFFAIWPPAWLYNALPMFRSYARFGVVVQLITALLAGVGFDALGRSKRWPSRALTATRAVRIVLIVFMAGEYAVSPLAMSRDLHAGAVVAAATSVPDVYTVEMRGFAPRERDRSWSWRWMGDTGTWTVRNTTAAPIVAALDVELSAFHHDRRLDVQLDGRSIAALTVSATRGSYQLGPFRLTPGDHVLTFHALEPSSVADTILHNGDTRALSVALGASHWITGSTK